jgi:hypothetical protein
MEEVEMGESAWKKREEEVKKKIQTLKGTSKIGTALAKETATENDKTVQVRRTLAHKVFCEGLDMYEEGEMTFKEFVEDLYKVLKAID